MTVVDNSVRKPFGMMWLSLTVLMMFMLPVLGASATAPVDQLEVTNEWWLTTNMDKNGDKIHDAIPIAIESTQWDWVDENGRIGVIVDFNHLPTTDDEMMLTEKVGFEVYYRYHLIHSIAGEIEVSQIGNLANLPGVVLVELDGVLSVQMADVKEVHGVTNVWDETGYTGAGSVVAIIDTGIDGDHVGLDDLDDNNETYDPKVIAFYDVINNEGLTNGTEIHPYDDQGHGSHCAGITAGTGAPDYQHVGVAPQAQLVGVKVLDSGGSGSFAQVMRGMEWTVEMRHEFNIRAASMSLGGPGVSEWTSSEQESVNRMANEMVRSGIAMFIAAGNAAFSAQIGTPGSAEDVITVGALDKDTGIAVYSSQGPTEEGRIKPNIAFVGSSVNSVAANSGDGYTSMSGTSMATPGAAGLAALMYQANPDLSPFDVRNIMQETATYRQCHYLLKNEPCADDLIPKNRQNNVYGHGHTNAEPSVNEAANQVYGLTLAINVSTNSPMESDNKIHIDPGQEVTFEIVGEGAGKIQWRTWDMRDYWSDHEVFETGDSEFSITHSMINDRLKYLPGNNVTGNQTIMVRAISGDNASTNAVVHLHIMGDTPIDSTADVGGSNLLVFTLATLLLVFAIGIILMFLMVRGTLATPDWGPFSGVYSYDDLTETSLANETGEEIESSG